MREFFKLWRRKIGVVTLVMACVFMGGWVRSRTIDEGVSFRTGKFMDMFLGSCPYGIIVATGKYSDSSFPSMNVGWFSKVAVDDGEAEEQADTKWYSSGFQFRTSGKGNFFHVVIPYWFLVLPLTALSAYLLLTKPRKSTQKKIVEPIPADGA